MGKTRPSPRGKLAGGIAAFLRLESSSGILLMLASAIALAWANSPWAEAYFHALEIDIGFGTLHHGINDGLMAVFFLVVGLEIKREMVAGELAGLKRAAFPVVAALGGMIVPALVYAGFNHGLPSARGWGIPMATDIPFALGILALLGNRVPVPLKIFLMALAIIDDLGAVIVIAVFYTGDISWIGLGQAAGVLAALMIGNRAGVRNVLFYLLPGILMGWLLHRSGVHSTIAGVLTAWTIPAGAGRSGSEPPLQALEGRLHPWSSFLILPLFALANAGVRIETTLLDSLGSRAGLGIMLGLLIGKPAGIFGAAWLMLRAGFPALSGGVTWKHLLGAGMLGGIGFTMSIFIAGLAFTGPELDAAKLSVFAGSALSGLAGWALLRSLPAPERKG